MDDEVVLQWLIGMTTYIANEHHRARLVREKKNAEPETNAGPNAGQPFYHEAFDEGFARWMGWRGEQSQEDELNAKRHEDPNTKRKPYRR